MSHLALGAVLSVNTLNSAGTLMQNDKEPAIVAYEGAEIKDEALVAFSGLGGYGSDLYCTLNAIDTRDIWGVFHNGRFDLEFQSRAIVDRAKQEGKNNLTILGDSAGGLMALKVTANLIKSGQINVKEVIIVTTPISASNLRTKERIGLELSSLALTIGGYSSRLPGELIIEFDRDYAKGTLASIKNVIERTSNMPNDVLEPQIDLVRNGAAYEDIETIVRAGTKITYFAPQNNNQDELVDTDMAYEDLKQMVLTAMAKTGIDLSLIDNYLTIARVGQKHSMITKEEGKLVNDGQWVRYTNAERTKYLFEISQLDGSSNGCGDTFRDVQATLTAHR
jgi:hypothetical protein